MSPTALLLLAPAVASSIGLPILDAPQPSDIATGIQQFANELASETTAVLTSVNAAVFDIVRVAYVTCLLVEVLLYYTHLGRRLGKDLMIGGVVLLVVAEFVIPAVAALSSG
jgi:hypothetical protein